MTTLLYDILSQMQDIDRLCVELGPQNEPVRARLADLVAEVENELHRQHSDQDQEVDSEQCC